MSGTPVFYLESHSLDPTFNLALEEYVLYHRQEGNYILLWQNDRTVVIGKDQDISLEIDPEAVERYGIRVVRRITGGGAVYHDTGNINYSYITDVGDAAHLTLEQFTAPIVKALKQLGLSAHCSGRNDIVIHGRKISGTAQHIYGGRILHHGTLLFDSDLSMLSQVLRADPLKLHTRGTRSVRSRVGNIREFLKEDMDLPSFQKHLKRSILSPNAKPCTLTKGELRAIRDLQEQKYQAEAWNNGEAASYEVSRKRCWDGGILEVRFTVEHERFARIGFFGDFLSSRGLKPITDALQGKPVRREAVKTVLEQFSLPDYFGMIGQKEILDTIFTS